MAAYLIRRLWQMVPTLFGVILLVFLLFKGFGGDPAEILAGQNATQALTLKGGGLVSQGGFNSGSDTLVGGSNNFWKGGVNCFWIFRRDGVNRRHCAPLKTVVFVVK